MTAKELLKKYEWMTATISQKEIDYKESLSVATSISVPTDGEKVSSSRISDRTAQYGIDLALQKKDLDDLKLKAESLKHLIVSCLDELEPNCRYYEVISYRWLRHMKWEEVADAMHYSLRQTLRIHGYALRELDVIVSKRCH